MLNITTKFVNNMSKPVDLGSLKEGSYILIDEEPCRIVSYDKSKPGMQY